MYTKEAHQSARFADEDEWVVVVKKVIKTTGVGASPAPFLFFAQSDNLKMQMRFYHLLNSYVCK